MGKVWGGKCGKGGCEVKGINQVLFRGWLTEKGKDVKDKIGGKVGGTSRSRVLIRWGGDERTWAAAKST